MSQASQALDVIETLAGLGHPAALVGGLAVSVRTRERFTVDIDFAVAVESDRQVESLAFSMQRRGYVLHDLIEQDAVGVISTLRFRHPEDSTEGPSIDLLFGSSGIEREVVDDATPTTIEHRVEIPVAQRPHLIAMKVLSVTPERVHDASDLHALITIASDSELDKARWLVERIEERGFSRGRDLVRSLENEILAIRPDRR